MILRSNNPAARNNTPEEKRADLTSLFQAPTEYQNGSRKRLNDFHNGEWWLNVDYVDSEALRA